MGIPRFYRWLSERYPLINEQITAEQIPEFDNLYLDMNGIIHNCSHNNTGGLCVKDESDVFVESFKYIVRLVHIIKPKQLLYMAIDGCAPRAKMNQQRSRRFRAANDAREAREKAEEMGETISGTPFDSNCITPGTEFMERLTDHIQFFVYKKIQEDPLWQGITVIVSGPDVPGEGEHKIMDYIRTSKAQPDYDPNLRHCLYGLDADLIMLALASHEPHFALLREEVVFGRQQTENVEQRMFNQKDRFQLLHISLVREYLELELGPPEDQPFKFQFDLERVIDDFILFCVLVGNDFLPHLPFAEIGGGGLDDFFGAYKHHLKLTARDPWLTGNCGDISWYKLGTFLGYYARMEDEKMQSAVDDGKFALGRRRSVGPKSGTVEDQRSHDIPVEPAFNNEMARVQYYEVKFGIDVDTHEGTQKQRSLFKSYLEGLQWVLHYYYRGPDKASWSWYYPYYHAPLIFDLAQYDELKYQNIQLEIGEPFKPFQQLMAVLPSNSKTLLPQCYQWLFDSPQSPILHFYPTRFDIDVDGVTVPWGGCTLIPFIDPASLLQAMLKAERTGPTLSAAESKRNSFRSAMAFNFDSQASTEVISTMPKRFDSIQRCPVRAKSFRHLALPPSQPMFFNGILPGCNVRSPGFPTLHRHPLTCSFESGVKVFQFEARGLSLILYIHPSGQVVPEEEAIIALLKAPCVQIDYPCVHIGKVVAVNTAHTRYMANDKKLRNNAREHENYVSQMTMECRRKGLSLSFDRSTSVARTGSGDVAAGRSKQHDIHGPDHGGFLQPIVEVKIVESTFTAADGTTHYKYSNHTEWRLLHLVRIEQKPPPVGLRSVAERFPLGTTVVCIAKDSECFGQVGVIERNGGEQLEARFEKGLSREECHELQYHIQRIIKRQHESLKWHDLSAVAKEAHLSPHVVRLICGSVMMRSPENVREDVGMNLVYESKHDGSSYCLPVYSRTSQNGWQLSDLAVDALKNYAGEYPALVDALKTRKPGDRDLDASVVFWNAGEPNYIFSKLIKYVNSCDFKKLRFVPEKYMALTPASAQQIASAIDTLHMRIAARPAQTELIKGFSRLYKAVDAGSSPPRELYPPQGEDIAVGQRVIYTKPHGLIPCGAKGTLVGIYGTGQTQECEVLLDEDSFGSTSLNGRVPGMRGFKTFMSSVMPLLPRISAGSPAPPATPLALELFSGTTSGWDKRNLPLNLRQAEEHEDVSRDSGRDRQNINNAASSALLNMLKSPPQAPARDPVISKLDTDAPPKSASQLVSSTSDRIMESLRQRPTESSQERSTVAMPLPKFGVALNASTNASNQSSSPVAAASSSDSGMGNSQTNEAGGNVSGKKEKSGGRIGPGDSKKGSKGGKGAGRGKSDTARGRDEALVDWGGMFEELLSLGKDRPPSGKRRWER